MCMMLMAAAPFFSTRHRGRWQRNAKQPRDEKLLVQTRCNELPCEDG